MAFYDDEDIPLGDSTQAFLECDDDKCGGDSTQEFLECDDDHFRDISPSAENPHHYMEGNSIDADVCKSRLNLLVFLVGILYVILIIHYSPGNDRMQHFWGGLEQFAVAAEKQMDNKLIPDMKQWRSQRIQTINTLKELRKKLDNVCFYASCGKAAGSGMGILCILSSLAAVFMGFIGAPFSLPVVSFGGIICPTGYLTKEASSVMESVLSAKYQNDLQAVLLKDKAVSKSLDEWLKFSPHLEMEFQKIFGFDLKSKNSMKFIWLKEFYELLTRIKNFEGALEQMKRGKYSSLLGESIGMDELRKFSKRILDSPCFSNKIRHSLLILNTLIGSTNYTRSLIKVYQNVRGEKMLSTILFLQDKLDIKIPFKVKFYAFILLNVLDIAKEVTSLIDETKIINDGKCPYSDSLKHITDMLEQELNIIESSFSI